MISNQVFEFLKQLGNNNNRDWFHSNKEEYEIARGNVENFVGQLIAGISKFDPDISSVDPKKSLFRIYRDVRFSKDKSPYKTNFGATIAKDKKMGEYGGYYVHIVPGGCFIAGGIYMPLPEVLKKIRQEIAFNLEEFKSILNNTGFEKYFSGIDSEKLSRMPKEFATGYGDEDLLKYKHYVVSHEINDKIVKSPEMLEYSLKVCKAIKPLNDFLNRGISV